MADDSLLSYILSFPLWLSYILYPSWMPHRLARPVGKPEATESYFLLARQCSCLAAHIAYYPNSLTYNTTLG